MKNLKLYRYICGGVWYKYQGTGQLPGLFGSWWSRKKLEPHRYYNLIKVEDYTRVI